MKRLIVNADDFGLTENVNRGILDAHREGIVTRTTLLANGMAFESAVAAGEPFYRPRVGGAPKPTGGETGAEGGANPNLMGAGGASSPRSPRRRGRTAF